MRAAEPVGEAVEALCGDDTVCRVDLTAFDLRQVEQVVRAALGGPVSRQTVRRLHDSSGGNALYLRELVSGALKEGALADDGEIWELAEGRTAGTPRLVELVSARLESAGPGGRMALELLALCEPVPLADAEALAAMDVLVELEAAGLIRTRTDRHKTSVSLAHPLYAEVLGAGLTPLRRRRLLLDQVDRAWAGADSNTVDTRRIAAWQLEATGTAEPALLIEAAAQARAAGSLLGEALLLADLARLGGAGQAAARLGEIAEAFDGELVPALAHLAAALAAGEPARLVKAAGELAALGADLMAAEAASAASAACARAGDTRRATAAARDARRHLERCGDRPRTPLLRESRTTATLTEREREITAMAARGIPSREIAEVLRVSVRTVQNHLQRAYTKLGVTNRSELRRALGG